MSCRFCATQTPSIKSNNMRNSAQHNREKRQSQTKSQNMNSMLPPLCLTIVGICVRGLAFATNVIPRGAPKDPPAGAEGLQPRLRQAPRRILRLCAFALRSGRDRESRAPRVNGRLTQSRMRKDYCKQAGAFLKMMSNRQRSLS
jgi:hypothetical protein